MLDKLSSFRMIFKPELILLILVVFSCTSNTSVELSLADNIDVKFREFNLPSTNLFIDSLKTDGENRILFGTRRDDLTGEISAEGYMQFVFEQGTLPGSADQTMADTLRYDSITLRLGLDRAFPSAQTVTLDIEVFELQDTLFNSVTYLSGKEEVKTRLLGRLVTNANVINTVLSSATVKLSDTYGREIFDLMADFPDTLRRYLFKGMALTPGVSSQALFRVVLNDDTTRMTVHMSSVKNNARKYTSQFAFTRAHYTHIDRDRSGSAFSGIVENNDFELADNRTILEPMSGITTAVDFSELNDFFDANPNILLNNVFLDCTIEPDPSRKAVPTIAFFFRKADGGIFGSAISENSLNNIVQVDNSYITRQSTPFTVDFDVANDVYTGSPTLFFQALYRTHLSTGRVAFVDPIRGDTTDVSSLVLRGFEQSPPNLPRYDEILLDRTFFPESGFKLRIYLK